jgi:alkanesulfonate monooxygenase SsuD/methylene tetrahydromethanopterin reductase-like flavin-dependent oxidoreductase (luciferase family)
MQLGLQLGYWGAGPPADAPALIAAAEEAGFAAVFTAESWGSDAFTPLAWWGAATTRVRLGTSVVQLSARTPTACAMHALTIDHLSGGRFALGLGAPVVNPGPHHPLPYQGPGALGLGKPLRPITHPLRADLPILLGAEGRRNIGLAAEIADGWLAVFYSPTLAPVYNEWLDAGFAKPGARRSRADFEVIANCQVVITDDRRSALDGLKPSLAHYIGGMGAPGMNFHADLFARAGFPDEVARITELFLAGRRAEAVAAVPDALVDEVSIVGTADHVRSEVARREAAGVSMLLVGCRDVAQVRALGALLLADAPPAELAR